MIQLNLHRIQFIFIFVFICLGSAFSQSDLNLDAKHLVLEIKQGLGLLPCIYADSEYVLSLTGDIHHFTTPHGTFEIEDESSLMITVTVGDITSYSISPFSYREFETNGFEIVFDHSKFCVPHIDGQIPMIIELFIEGYSHTSIEYNLCCEKNSNYEIGENVDDLIKSYEVIYKGNSAEEEIVIERNIEFVSKYLLFNTQGQLVYKFDDNSFEPINNNLDLVPGMYFMIKKVGNVYQRVGKYFIK